MEVTLSKGATRNATEFSYTADQNAETTISITTITPDPENISNGFGVITTNVGYSGFQLTAGRDITKGGICNRTAEVQTAILGRIGRLTGTVAEDCDEVTVADLTAITDLNLFNQSITSLKSGDFAGLTALTSLDLSVNQLETLPNGIFSDLGSLRLLFLQINSLMTLPEGIFSSLTSLTTLELGINNLTESTLPGDIFSGLTSLTILNLGGNDFNTLPAGIFSGLTNLTGVLVNDNPNTDSDPLTLTVAPKMISDGVAVIEVAPGVPFTKVTADLTITGGTFSNGMTTMTGVEILQGDTQSPEFAYTVDPNEISTVITVSTLTPDPENILDSFAMVTAGVGYNGFQLAAGEPLLVLGNGICNRTMAVQTIILSQISGVSDCADVTVDNLETVGFIVLAGTPSLQAGDFVGLTGVATIQMQSITPTTLPSGLFDGLTSLTSLILSLNNLETLPADIFNGLTNLQILNLSLATT